MICIDICQIGGLAEDLQRGEYPQVPLARVCYMYNWSIRTHT